MYQDDVVLCASSKYTKKYYLNEDFEGLPKPVKDELKIMCVLFTDYCGGILTLEFEKDGTLLFCTRAYDYDYLYDAIETGLQVRRLQKEKRELLESLELYYRIAVLGENE